jgi:hypothetical protein
VNVTSSEAANDMLAVDAGGGDDIVDASALAATVARLTIDGGDGNDSLIGSAGDDVILGGAGDDLLIGGPGIDTLDGGPGGNVVIQDSLPVGPNGIQAHSPNEPFLVGHGVGVQIYACNGTTWSFVSPRANLFADNGTLLVTHFGGPSWRSTDGSTVVGTAVNSATVDPTAIPWVLLSASPAPGSPPGRLAPTTFIQRVDTTGGLVPPASECNATTAGTQSDVPYTADYVFWK